MHFWSPGPGGRGAPASGGLRGWARRGGPPAVAPPHATPQAAPRPCRAPLPAAAMGPNLPPKSTTAHGTIGKFARPGVWGQRAGPGVCMNLGQRPLCPEPWEARTSRVCAVVSDWRPTLASPPLGTYCRTLCLLQEALQTSPRPSRIHHASPSRGSVPTTKANKDAAR